MMEQDMIDNRKCCYAKLQIAKKQLGIDDDAYRVFLTRHGAREKDGRISATTMSPSQLDAALHEMQVKGFRPRPKGGAQVTDWRAARVAKLRAMWIALAETGVVRDRSDVGLSRFCARITKVARLEWLNSRQLSDCVTALRTWAGREGVLKE